MMKNEAGRSMVEMLGVLAIIGVLSVAGIAGYSMAMRKLKANDIIDLASKARIVAMAGDGGNGRAYTSADLASITGASKDADLCATSGGFVQYQISDTKLKDVVEANKPSWLCEGTCASVGSCS